MLLLVLCLLLGCCSPVTPGRHAAPPFPFWDATLSWDERLDDLVNRLTVDEIRDQMAYGGRSTHAPGISRLGVPPYPWGSECISGDVGAGPATSFPEALGLAATFSRRVVHDMSCAVGQEVRAKFNNYTAHGDYGMHTSASCWSPVINIMRDPRWGRNQETYGEDPWMSGQLAAAYVDGLQGDHPRYVLANAGCKHFDVYAGPENIPVQRHVFDAKVSETDWRMTFLPAFKQCVQAGTYSLMCSYNSINGIPACANKKLLTDILRGEWGFQGYVISDEGAIEDIQDNHKYTSNQVDTAAAAINAGTNLEDGPSNRPIPYFAAISDAVKQGKLNMSTIRQAVRPLFYTRMRLGLFDPPKMNPYSKLDPTYFIQSEAHRKMATLAAMRSFVLLKNSNQFLPLKPGTVFDKMAIVGPMSDEWSNFFGGYAPTPDPRYIVSPREGLAGLGRDARWTAGCVNSDPHCSDYDRAALNASVSGAQLVVVCLGTGARLEAESNDRKDIALAGKQLQLLQDTTTFAPAATVVLLLFNGGPLDVSWAQQSARVAVIMECFFPAQTAGIALRRVFLGQGAAANPAGRLPNTWPATLTGYPAMTNYSMAGRTYRYPAPAAPAPLYPFGYGLSYSRYHYRRLAARPAVLAFTNSLKVDVYLHNLGPYDGEEVVQLYMTYPPGAPLPTPALQLVGFDRYYVGAGAGLGVTLAVTWEQLSVWDPHKHGFVVLPGLYTLYAGGQQPGQKVDVGSNVLNTTFTVTV